MRTSSKNLDRSSRRNRVPSDAQLAKIFALVHHVTGVDLRIYKTPTLRRRVSRRISLAKLPSVDAYIDRLRKDRAEVESLYGDSLIGVTSFYRDPATFRTLCQKVFPKLVKKRAADRPIRIWVPGCSTGEEVYSIAMSLLDCAGARRVPIQIFGTDVSETALSKARAGIYPDSVANSIPAAALERHFKSVPNGYQVNKA